MRGLAMIRLHVDEDKLAEFCRRWHIRRLSFFGSVVRQDFRADSDVDVLVKLTQPFVQTRNSSKVLP